jgi:hypothetical protein
MWMVEVKKGVFFKVNVDKIVHVLRITSKNIFNMHIGQTISC